jgi:hypothetical protein
MNNEENQNTRFRNILTLTGSCGIFSATPLSPLLPANGKSTVEKNMGTPMP